MKKIKTAFIYKKSNPYMSQTAWATTYYHFFMNALNRHDELEMTYFPAENEFDAAKLKNKFDIILLWENHPWGTPDVLHGISDLSIFAKMLFLSYIFSFPYFFINIIY